MSAQTWLRTPWPWRVADYAERAGWCWADVCSWAVDRTSPTYSADDGQPCGNRRLRGTRRASVCARSEDVARYGLCYCGGVGRFSPGEERRLRARARRRPFVRGLLGTAAALVVLFLGAGAASVPERPAGTAPPCVVPAAAERLGAGGCLVTEQLLDPRGGGAP